VNTYGGKGFLDRFEVTRVGGGELLVCRREADALQVEEVRQSLLLGVAVGVPLRD
jgi:hypothetical protein